MTRYALPVVWSHCLRKLFPELLSADIQAPFYADLFDLGLNITNGMAAWYF